MISAGRLWWLIQRDFRRGWRASFHYYFTLPKIAGMGFEHALPPAPPVPVHVLTGREDWLLAAWMLASWFAVTGMEWRIVIHDDGTLPTEAKNALQQIFPRCRFIDAAVADQTMKAVLASFPNCLKYRFEHPLARKIFDVPHFTEGDRFLLFDSDLLFFRRPDEILQWTRAGVEECWFNADVADSSFVSRDEARTRLGVDLWPKVNSGLCLVSKKAMDLAFCEQCLQETSVLEGKLWRVEQTLFALCASKLNRGGLLPPSYLVTLDKHAPRDIIARHYVGPVRDQFYGEGLSRCNARTPLVPNLELGM